ncbi:hypothetical protein TNCV_3260871 [Trichonephila clavipes]|nr:hypothetical protein TNCV_3260871 [Trichonephila clavipes]
MESSSGQSFIPTNLGCLDEEMIPEGRGYHNTSVVDVSEEIDPKWASDAKKYPVQLMETVLGYRIQKEKKPRRGRPRAITAREDRHLSFIGRLLSSFRSSLQPQKPDFHG